MDKEDVIKLGAASAFGAVQPFVIKKYIIKGTTDVNYVPQLPYGMGKLSSLVNTGLAGGAIAAALIGGLTKFGRGNLLGKSEVQEILLAYGVPALTVGIALDVMGASVPATFSMAPIATSVRGMGPSVTVRSASAVPQPKVYGAQRFY